VADGDFKSRLSCLWLTATSESLSVFLIKPEKPAPEFADYFFGSVTLEIEELSSAA
jgi:hypothetical protein